MTTAVRRRCYEAFKDAYGSNADEILEKFREVQIVKNAQRQTGGQRKKDFKKAEAKLIEFVSAPSTITSRAYLNVT